MIHEVRVTTNDRGPRGVSLLRELRTTLGIAGVTAIHMVKVYRFEGEASVSDFETLVRSLLCDPVMQTMRISRKGNGTADGVCVVEVAYKPGVMNPEAASLVRAAHDRGLTDLVAADSSWEYHFHGSLTESELAKILGHLMNPTVARVVTEPPTSLRISDVSGSTQLVVVSDLDDGKLEELSRQRSLFLHLDEMQVIQAHFRSLNREPTDAELETLAQTWSEHCSHKTFRARLHVDGRDVESLMGRLKARARTHARGVLSSFVDNSGVIEFFEGWAICGKVETHNSPCGLEPYGGAMTGSGGVFRDILGTGQGARVILSTDMFCFAPPTLPTDQVPPGCLPPRHLFQQVVAGVRDYGNRMGVPTANGSVHFHSGFRAKPTVIVGAYGIMRADQCQKGVPRPGDAVLVIGGRTGRDGIHGATFSSAAMTDQTASVNAAAVQIGNAIEEKRTADALLQCRDEGLIRAVTDCGAGGFASAIGEMGAQTGVRVALERAPLKYPGLAPWEIWLSESQERMVLAVAPEHVDHVVAICAVYNVEATALGTFTDDRQLDVTYHGTNVCDLDMRFLHEGLPQRTMIAERRAAPVCGTTGAGIRMPRTPEAWCDVYRWVLGCWNVCSKESIVRMYDHGVQGTSALPPFSGVRHDGPNDAVVLRPLPDKPYGLVVAHGLNPVLNQMHPFDGSLWAAVEALSNYVAVGGDFRHAALIDNFIWPFPDAESLWDLDQAVDACCAVMEAFGIPFVSGKDSLSSTYRRGEFVLKIPPVLCVSVFGRIPNVEQTVTADFKRPGSHILLVGKPDTDRLGGSAYYDVHGCLGAEVPHVDLGRLPSLFDWVHRHIVRGDIVACHDISEGGMAAALAEMCFGGACGASIRVPEGYDGQLDSWFFHETAGCFLLEVPAGRVDALLSSVASERMDSPVTVLGTVMEAESITLMLGTDPLFSIPTALLKNVWEQPMKEVFHT